MRARRATDGLLATLALCSLCASCCCLQAARGAWVVAQPSMRAGLSLSPSRSVAAWRRARSSIGIALLGRNVDDDAKKSKTANSKKKPKKKAISDPLLQHWPLASPGRFFIPLPGSDDADHSQMKSATQGYLERLTLYTDDGLPLLRAADRYSSNDWLTILLTTPQSMILKRIKSHLLFSTGWSAIVSLCYRFLPPGWLPIPSLLHSFVGSMLGVLLAFRMQQSYERFWEGRAIWTTLIGDVRHISLLVSGACEESKEMKSAVWRLLAAYPVALKQYLRGRRDLTEFAGILSSEELANLKDNDNWPLAVVSRLEGSISSLRFTDPNIWWMLSGSIKELVHVIGAAEKLVRTPVPLSYVRHSSRFLSLYVLTLPLTLVNNMHSLLVPAAVGAASWALFSIEEIGHLVEEPFGARATDSSNIPKPEMLPLERYCDSIRHDLTETFDELIDRVPDAEGEEGEGYLSS